MPDPFAALQEIAQSYAARAHVPYSGQPEAAVALLADGAWVPGVRVESASFSLTLPAALNAVSTAVAAGRQDVVAVVSTRAWQAEDLAYLAALPGGALTARAAHAAAAEGPLPALTHRLDPFLPARLPLTAEAGIALAQEVAGRAYVPASAFRVGCVAVAGGVAVPGVNVEHRDWARILCAERNALGTALTWGLPPAEHLFLSCPSDPSGTPCGACRQWLAELTPEAMLWMDRGAGPPEAVAPPDLLPGFFRGATLIRPS